MPIDRFKLHGNYRTPLFKYGATVEFEVRGEMIITGISDASIPWPVGRIKGQGGSAYLVIYKGLARAVKRESNQAVAHHFGVTPQTVTAWRKALGVDRYNPGTHKVMSAHYHSGIGEKVVAGSARVSRDAKLDAPRRAKIAAAKRGKKKGKHRGEDGVPIGPIES